jgi:hypothetical protein
LQGAEKPIGGFMYAPGHITREKKAKNPFFNDHKEVREWFKEKYVDGYIINFMGSYQEIQIMEDASAHIVH